MVEEGQIVPLSEVKKLLEKEEKGRELSYEQRLALEHSKQFTTGEVKESPKVIKKLMQIERINETLATKIVELSPKSENEVRAIFAKERFNLEPEEIKQILDMLSEA
jgi:DNA-directed RNA polymerase subunit F